MPARAVLQDLSLVSWTAVSLTPTDKLTFLPAVVPYFPYSRQSKKKSHRGAITARMLANLMNIAGVDHVITVDLHATQMQGFFKCPVDNLLAEPLLSKWIRHNVHDWRDAVVVSKNPGGTKRVTSLADALRLSFGIVTTDRKRPHTGLNSMMNSLVFEPMGTDGTLDKKQMEVEQDEQHIDAASSSHAPIEHDFARNRAGSGASIGQSDASARRPSRPRAATTLVNGLRNRLINGDATPSSPLVRSTRIDSIDSPERPIGLYRAPTAPGVIQPPAADEDGYESPPGDEDEDEVRTGYHDRSTKLTMVACPRRDHWPSHSWSYRRRRRSVARRVCRLRDIPTAKPQPVSSSE